ncbi:MAG: tripartite tricarboxylate transporter substrate-binding protein [Betaproteobacteria bacterium]|nr:tripartite tricarboxylate transporter substrate-binding protein [Betaproteobacteria bacterium]
MTDIAACRSRSIFAVLRSAGSIACAGVFVALAWQAPPAAAQQYPAKVVKVLVPYGPGGATDIIARHLATRLTETLEQPFVVENRPGASGNLALEASAKAAPDGYTLLVGNVTTNAINESMFAHVLHIKPSRDLIGITKLVEIPHILAVTPSFAVKNVAEAIDYARKNPGKLNYASAGVGSYPHLDMLRLLKTARVDMTHVPYKGGAGQMVPSLMSGETQLAFINLSSTIAHIRSGRIRAIATTAPAQLAEIPGVATMAEQSFAGIGTNAWQGLFAPAGTPPEVIDKLFEASSKILSRPEMKEMLARQMLSVALSKSPADFRDLVQKETRAWGEFIQDNKIKAE